MPEKLVKLNMICLVWFYLIKQKAVDEGVLLTKAGGIRFALVPLKEQAIKGSYFGNKNTTITENNKTKDTDGGSTKPQIRAKRGIF